MKYRTVKEAVTDSRRCPTCGHCHPNGIGAGWCPCEDCGLLWTRIPRAALAPAFQTRFDELTARSTTEAE